MGGHRVFQARYASGMHLAQGRYPAATAVGSSAKNTRWGT
jgi:hypothetical protein